MLPFLILGRNSKFNADVLKEIDDNGDLISTWCIPGKKSQDAICTFCNVVISCKHHGVSAIKRHATTDKHKTCCNKRRNDSGKLKESSQPRITFKQENPAIRSHADIVTTSETLFAITVAKHDVPYSFCDVIGNLFPRMFPDSQIANEVTCSHAKMSYFISDGIGPYLKNQLVNDIINSNCFFAIMIDETPVPEKRTQQLDVFVRYFSKTDQEIQCHHLESFFIGKSTAENISKHVCEALAPLPSHKMLCFYSDGPSVMKCLYKIMKTNYPQIVDISTCPLHVVHNAFSKALSEFGSDVEELIIDIYYFFKRSAVRSSELKLLQNELSLPDHVFLRHVSNRWLTLRNSLERFIEQFECLKSFFYRDIKSREESNRLKNIKEAFTKDKLLLVKALFLKNASDMFCQFLKTFQSHIPLIHFLYEELTSLVKKVMGRFLKVSTFQDIDGHLFQTIDIENGKHWLKNVEIGLDTRLELSKYSDAEKKIINMGARLFYKTCTKYLIQKLPFENNLLKHLYCLHPNQRSVEKSLNSIKFLASSLPNIVKPCEFSDLSDEWVKYQCEEIDQPAFSEISIHSRIDHYWRKIFDLRDSCGKIKYVILPVLVKSLLCLPHGNADIERGFSKNNRMLESRSNLSIYSVNGIRQIKSYFQESEKIKKYEVTPTLLKSVRNSWKRYHERLNSTSEKMKRKLEDETVCEADDLKEEEAKLQKQLTLSQKMLAHAENKISQGIKENDMSAIESGQVLLTEGKQRIDKTLLDIEKNRAAQANCQAAKKKK